MDETKKVISDYLYPEIEMMYKDIKHTQELLTFSIQGGGPQNISATSISRFFANLLVNQYIGTENKIIRRMVREMNTKLHLVRVPKYRHVMYNIGCGNMAESLSGLQTDIIAFAYCVEIDDAAEELKETSLYKYFHNMNRLHLRIKDFSSIHKLPDDVTHIYCTALVGPSFYEHLLTVAINHQLREDRDFPFTLLTMFNHMWRQISLSAKKLIEAYEKENVLVSPRIKLQGGGTQFQFITLRMNTEIAINLRGWLEQEFEIVRENNKDYILVE